MPNFSLEMQSTTSIRIDAIGKPGHRVFYFQSTDDQQMVTLLIEKFQIQILILGAGQFLKELEERFPNLPKLSNAYLEESMRIHPPVDPIFRAEEITLGYDIDNDRIVIIFQEARLSDRQDQKPSEVKVWCSRSMLAGLISWTEVLISRGRQANPATGESLPGDGQFSPKNNGHKH